MSKTILVERDVEMHTRDGVVLRADVYHTEGSGPLPVLLMRTPYGKGFANLGECLMAAERGYTVVLQDTRGRWNSGGESPFPFMHERNDGYDTVEWAARQPWSNGSVGMFGGSYVGYTQLAAASTRPPSLKAIAPMVTFSSPRAVFYQDNAVSLGVGVAWGMLAWTTMAIMRSPASDVEKARMNMQLIAAANGMTDGSTFRVLPLMEMPMLGKDSVSPLMIDVTKHPTNDQFWQAMNCGYEDICVPALHVGGWYDMFTAYTLNDYNGIRRQGNPSQKLMMGPWTHGLFTGLVGEVDFGLQAYDLTILSFEMQMRWFDHWLKGIPNGVMDEPPVRIFVMGDDIWRDEQEWPLARTQYTPLYLDSGGAANGITGDGILRFEAPDNGSPVDTFLYDPRNPVPTRGGGVLGWNAAMPPGAYDQRAIEARPDVLVYSTPPLERDLEVTGPLEARIWVATTAPCTDFTAKLVDVRPDGYARNVQDGIVRLGSDQPLEQGKAVETIIHLAATSNVFKSSHRIRLEISSSNFPRFDRNLNTRMPLGQGSETCTALQTILHDPDHPSRLILPVIPR